MERNFPNNSQSKKGPPRQAQAEPPPEKVVRQVTVNKVVRRNTPMGTRLRETFFGGSSKNVFQHVIMDIIVPETKNMILDAVNMGLEQKLLGESGGRRRGSSVGRTLGGQGYTSYSKMSGPPVQSRREDPRAIAGRTSTNRTDFGQYILGSRPEANDALEEMYNILGSYEVVSQRDFFNIIGVDSVHTDEKWGWDDLRGSQVRRANGGYLIDLPRPKPIE